MKFNAAKFEMLRYWPRKGSKPDNYKDPAGTDIEEKDHLRDLGVELSSDLTFHIHIENVVNAASKLTGWALRTFRRRSRKLMLTVWKTLIQTKLDYCSQLWSPSNQAAISKLESVAKHFTAQVGGLDGLNYWERHANLRMFSQEHRRERYQIIFVWKLSQGLVGGYNLEFGSNARRGRYLELPPFAAGCPASVRQAMEARGAGYLTFYPSSSGT